jgi:phosphoserine aminotransferase
MFSTIPLNFANKTDTVDYIVNGYWSEFAATEASKFCNVNISNMSTFNDYTICPYQKDLKISSDSKYVHYCDNETIHGCEFDYIPDIDDKPLICDMSSNFLSKPIDITKFAMIYAGSHKNIGPAGMVLVIIRKDMLMNNKNDIPTMLNLKKICETNSMLNTPPIFPIYVAGLTFKKIFDMGGLDEIKKSREFKAQLFYNTIDNSNGFYHSKMKTRYRSKMNIPFELKKTHLEKKFIEQAKNHGFIGLNGHHIVGHCRVSLYNTMPVEGVTELCNFMIKFMLHNLNEV